MIARLAARLAYPLAHRLWPRSLATRTALALLLGLALVQAAGLLAYSLDRVDLLRLAQAQELGQQIDNVYRSVVMAAPQRRQAALRELDAQSDLVATLDLQPAPSDLEPSPPPVQRILRISLQFARVQPAERWTELQIRGVPWQRRMLVSLRLPEGEWLNIRLAIGRFPTLLSGMSLPVSR